MELGARASVTPTHTRLATISTPIYLNNLFLGTSTSCIKMPSFANYSYYGPYPPRSLLPSPRSPALRSPARTAVIPAWFLSVGPLWYGVSLSSSSPDLPTYDNHAPREYVEAVRASKPQTEVSPLRGEGNHAWLRPRADRGALGAGRCRTRAGS